MLLGECQTINNAMTKNLEVEFIFCNSIYTAPCITKSVKKLSFILYKNRSLKERLNSNVRLKWVLPWIFQRAYFFYNRKINSPQMTNYFIGMTSMS